MRTLSDALEKAQKAGTLNPLYKIVLTKGESYTYEKDRIRPSEHDEAIYSHTAKIVLDNSKHELDDKNLKGYDAVISYGFASEYSATAPLSVMDQQFDSDPNKLTCTLFLEGIPNLMAEDEASESYLPDSDDTKTVKTLVDAIAGATLDCFSHCHAYDVVWKEGYDPLADTYKPKDSLRIYSGNSRLAILRRILDFTANVPRFEADGNIHILKLVTSGDTFDSEYSLERGQHQFFSKAYRETLVFPNRIVVKSQPDDDPPYSGEAQVDGYDSLPAKVKKTKFVQIRLKDDDQAQDIAKALIAKAEMGSKRGQAEVPLNVGAEVFDYDKVTDSRQGDTRTGNLGYIHRRFGGDKWVMTFGFGNWFDALRYQKMLKELENYTDAGQYFSRLSVGDLYAEHILADNVDFVWIDPEGNIDLDKIGDNIDNLADGGYFARERRLHLDATGVYVHEETRYTLRMPDEGDNNLWKSTTPPTAELVGDIWLDLNYTPNKVKRWTGSAWEEVSEADRLALEKGVIVRRLKGAALTADGLIVLDETQAGTYGLVLTTDISAGHILLSKTTKDGLWYEEQGVVLDATYGIALYGGEGINAFRTFATKAAYEAGTPVQVYIGTDGKLYAGGGNAWLDSSGIGIDGETFWLYYEGSLKGHISITASSIDFGVSADGYDLGLRAKGDVHIGSIDGGDIVVISDITPITDNTRNIGTLAKQFYGGYFKSRLKIPVGVDMYD